MRIRWQDQFKEDFKSLEKHLKDPIPFKKALNKAVTLLQTGKNLSRSFPVNRLIKRGEGWFYCYLTSDIVMIYKIPGKTVKLIAMGRINEMYDR